MWAVLVGAVAGAVLLAKWRRSSHPLGDYLGLAVVYGYARLWHRCTCAGPRPIPPRGPVIVIANHTCSADPAFLSAGCPRPLGFLVAREYYKMALQARFFEYIGCVPVRRNGRDALAVRVALRRLREGRVLCLFPEGGLSNAGRPRLRRGKAGAALLALRSRAPVVPAWISGGPQTSDIARAWLGRSRVRVRFGNAVDLSAYYGRRLDRKLLEEVTRVLMAHLDALRPENHKRGVVPAADDEPPG
jgi:1-acyl-sn-glycerol-3-phosphate acyltransferase